MDFWSYHQNITRHGESIDKDWVVRDYSQKFSLTTQVNVTWKNRNVTLGVYMCEVGHSYALVFVDVHICECG